MKFWFGRKNKKNLMQEEQEKEASPASTEEVRPEAQATSEQETASKSAETEGATEKTAAPEEAKPETAKPEPAATVEPDWKDRYARLMADFDNFKKRTARDRDDTYRFAEADILGDILPTVDNLSLALANVKVAEGEKEDSFVSGVRLVYDALLKMLGEHGAEPFDSIGKSLDTERMEAIATLPSAEVEEGLVSNEVKRGWLLKGRVLRAAQVVVSSGKPA